MRRDLGVDVEGLPGAGAAGGLGAGLVAFTGAGLRPGAEMVMQALKLDDRIRGADLVMTGEGRLDSQTARFGKGPAAVARHERNAGIRDGGVGGCGAGSGEISLLFDGGEPSAVEPGSPRRASAHGGAVLGPGAGRPLCV